MMNVAKILIVTLMFLLTVSGGYFIEQTVSAQTEQPKTAEQAFKNIQVLKEMPADQMLTTMSFIAGSLGVDCNYCHVNPFDKDEKPTKARAREMMLMMRKINADNFKGSIEVNCATCHQGRTRPRTTAPLASVDVKKILEPGAAPGPLPAADEILAKYAQALGGKDKVDKLTTLVMKGSLTTVRGTNPPQTLKGEIYRKAPNKLMMVQVTPNGSMAQAYNGTIVWRGNEQRSQEVHGPDVNGARLDATFTRNLVLKEQFSAMEVKGREQIGDKEAYVVEGTYADTALEKNLFGVKRGRLYFDTKSGLLLRRTLELDTALGRLPEQTDFDDYRAVEGVMVPFTIITSRPPFTNIMKFTEITVNTPLDDAKFDMPKKPAGQ
jgi:photosynthetic reaction center cytochrome c subunit